MMKFIRKYQRLLFIIISVVTIASFSFFGTFGSLASQDHTSEQEIAKAIDGSPITDRDIVSMVHFFSFGNRSSIENDFLATGLGAILAEHYFEEIKSDFATRLEKAKRYTPYRPAEEVWKRFIPQLNDHLTRVKEGNLSPATFSLYTRLYLDQTLFPPEALKRVLTYQHRQMHGAQAEPSFEASRLALFGYHSLEDWFGKKYLELLAMFLINTSKIAEEKGYSISNEEAKADLLQNAFQTLQSMADKQEVTYAHAEELLQYQFRLSGIDAALGTKIWKRVMLCRRLFDDVGSAVFVDPLTYKQFAFFASEKANIELYELPTYLRLKDFSKLQSYIEAIAPKQKEFRLPTTFLSAQEVEKRAPHLVQSPFLLEVSKVSKDEIDQKISLKQTWDWETTDEGWGILKQQFPVLDKSKEEPRFKILEALDPDFRLKVDRFARRQIVDRHPEWLEEAFEKAPVEKINVAIRSKGAVFPFTDIEDPTKLLAFLSENEKGTFSSDQETFYRIAVLERPACKTVMTFEEASRNNLLKDKAVDGSLTFVPLMEEARKSIQEKGDDSPFLKKTGDPLKDQWLLIKRTVDVKRSDPTTFSKDEVFSLAAQSWSSVHPAPEGEVSFFRLLDRKEASDPIAEEIDLGQKILSMDARRLLMHQLLDKIDKR